MLATHSPVNKFLVFSLTYNSATLLLIHAGAVCSFNVECVTSFIRNSKTITGA